MTGVPHIAAPDLRPLYDDWEWQSREAMHARRLRETRAKLVCARCPVLEPCRTHALSLPEEEGVWGGMTAEERSTLRRSWPSLASPPLVAVD